MDKKTLRNDLILIGSLLLAAIIAFVIVFTTRSNNNLVATVRVQNQVVLTIDLNKENDTHHYVEGTNGKVHIHVKDGAIAIVESNCPHQDCVHMGYVKVSGRPIICAYNCVSITIEGSSNNDIEVG